MCFLCVCARIKVMGKNIEKREPKNGGEYYAWVKKMKLEYYGRSSTWVHIDILKYFKFSKILFWKYLPFKPFLVAHQ